MCNWMKAGIGMVIVGGAIVAGTLLAPSVVRAEAQHDKPAMKPSMADSGKKSLYERLGGTYAIAAVIDDFVNALPGDKVIMSNPQTKAAVEKAAASAGLPGLKYQITAFVIEATGGPYKYNGKTMKAAHEALKITQAEWDEGVVALKATLDKFKVPAKEQDELIAIVATTHDDIVMPAKSMH